MKILVVPGWYPNHLEPLNGLFISDFVRLLRQTPLSIDTVYSDLNIRYLKYHIYLTRSEIRVDQDHNKDYRHTGPTWPKNNAVGFQQWKTKAQRALERYIAIEGAPDIIHAHTYLGAIISYEFSKKLNIPFIITEHFTGWINGTISKRHKSYSELPFRHADLVTAVGRCLATQLESLSKSVEIVPNFIDTDVFKPDHSHRQDGKNFKIVWVGDLIKRKNPLFALEIFKHLFSNFTNLELFIIGDGPLHSNLESFVQKHLLSKNVHFCGTLPSKEIANILNKSHLLLSTSKLETFGISSIEALCCDLPVVAVSNGGETDKGDLSGVHSIDSDMVETFAEAIKNIITEKITYTKGEIALAAHKKYGIKNLQEYWKKKYESLLIN